VFIVQVNWLGGAITELGKATSWLITTVPVAVQLFAGLVTVKVYVPGWFMFGFQVFPPDTMLPPPLATQLGNKVGSPGGTAGPMFRSVTAQVSMPGLPAGAGGGCMLDVTVTEADEVQPVVMFVI
jgi:hypothetical protein